MHNALCKNQKEIDVLKGFVVAIVVVHGFQQNEMTSPRKALEDAGAIVHIISTEKNTVQGWDWYVPKPLDNFTVDVHIDDANADHHDALLLPGGISSPDDLRLSPQVISFVKKICT